MAIGLGKDELKKGIPMGSASPSGGNDDGGETVDAYTKEESDAKYATITGTNELLNTKEDAFTAVAPLRKEVKTFSNYASVDMRQLENNDLSFGSVTFYPNQSRVAFPTSYLPTANIDRENNRLKFVQYIRVPINGINTQVGYNATYGNTGGIAYNDGQVIMLGKFDNEGWFYPVYGFYMTSAHVVYDFRGGMYGSESSIYPTNGTITGNILSNTGSLKTPSWWTTSINFVLTDTGATVQKLMSSGYTATIAGFASDYVTLTHEDLENIEDIVLVPWNTAYSTLTTTVFVERNTTLKITSDPLFTDARQKLILGTTQEKLLAINTDTFATSNRVDEIAQEVVDVQGDIASLDADKQDKLTAGEGITIDENNVISATGGGGLTEVDWEDVENRPTFIAPLVENKLVTSPLKNMNNLTSTYTTASATGLTFTNINDNAFYCTVSGPSSYSNATNILNPSSAIIIPVTSGDIIKTPNNPNLSSFAVYGHLDSDNKFHPIFGLRPMTRPLFPFKRAHQDGYSDNTLYFTKGADGVGDWNTVSVNNPDQTLCYYSQMVITDETFTMRFNVGRTYNDRYYVSRGTVTYPIDDDFRSINAVMVIPTSSNKNIGKFDIGKLVLPAEYASNPISSINYTYVDGLENTFDFESAITSRTVELDQDYINSVNSAIEDKQDKLTAGEGITIDENNVISATGGEGGTGGTSNYNDLTNKPTINTMELKGELALGGALKIEQASTDAFYNSARNASKQLTFSVASGYFVKINDNYNYSYGTGGLTINSDRTITPSSYFMMPYKLGDILVYGRGVSNNTKATILYGYKINGEFKPVLATSYAYSQSYPKITSFLNTYKRFASTYYKDEQLYTFSDITPNSTYKDSTTYPELATSSYGMSSLIYDESLGLYKMYRKTGTTGFYEYQLDTSINVELQKVNTVMVLYSEVITTPSVHSSFDIKDGSTVSGNFLTNMTYSEVMALPSVEVPEVIEHNVLSTGNIPNSYIGLDEKPKINGNELVGNINSTDLNIQRVMTPNGGINIVQNGDWHFFDASYDNTTRKVTFNRYNLYTSSGDSADVFNYALDSTSANASKIGTYVDEEKIIPTCGIITPFYKNVTWKFGWNNYINCNRLVFGNYIDGYFYPKYIICPPSSSASSSGAHFKKITGIVNNNSTVFGGTNVPLTVSSIASKSYSVSPIGYITILYDNNTYTFKYSHSTVYNGYYYYYSYKAVVTDDTEGLNSCTHCWYIPNNNDLGYNGYTQLAMGDWSSDCFNNNIDNTELNDSLILPDSGSNVFTTSISVKTDGVTTKINDAGALEAVAPANMITTDNIASVSQLGVVKPDGTSITVDASGTISVAIKIHPLTQAQYDALATKDPNVLYVIVPEEEET